MKGKVSFVSGDYGTGVRTVIFLSGCNKKCKGCNQELFRNPEYGSEIDSGVIRSIFNAIENTDVLHGITITGGEPLLSADQLYFLIKKFKQEFPEKTVWLYTGYTWEEAKKNPLWYRLLKLCDVVVDGEYKYKQKDESYEYRGSMNERIIDVTATIATKSIIIYDPTEE